MVLFMTFLLPSGVFRSTWVYFRRALKSSKDSEPEMVFPTMQLPLTVHAVLGNVTT
jgi:hypothetical protein